MLDSTTNQLSKFKTKTWVEITDDASGTYKENNQIEFKTSMLKSTLYDYSDAYLPVGGTIAVWAQAGFYRLNHF